MRAKILLRSIGLIALILAVGGVAYGFVSDNNKQDTGKEITDATDKSGSEIAQATDAVPTEEVSAVTETPKATEIASEVTEAPHGSIDSTESVQQGTEATTAPEATTTPTPEVTPTPQPEEPAIKTYTLVITKGTSARQIANRLETNGIIADADEFTEVLVNRGVTEDINVGSFEFTSDHTYDQIIAALTGKQK